MERFLGESTPKLGFGLMRLPRGEDGKYDQKQVEEMIDRFMAAGMTYFDTAFAYDGGDSERVANTALVQRYPRDSFTLATKLCSWSHAENPQAARQQLDISLERSGAGYFDYYLLHSIQEGSYKLYEDYKLWNFVEEEKAKGRIRHWGFSFHDTPELLDRVLTEHPGAEFVPLQINSADWEDPRILSRANYEVARKHGKAVVIMEPVKGGILANPPRAVQEILRSANPDASFASWAIRFAASLDGVLTVLSGMSTLGQMDDNLSYMKDFQPLSAEEQKVIEKAREALASAKSVPCTACHYCTPGCPQKIAIPEIFAARNQQLVWERMEAGQKAYQRATEKGGLASGCIECGQCESVCPQQIPIIEWLKECAQVFEK